jgi:protein SCO1/2
MRPRLIVTALFGLAAIALAEEKPPCCRQTLPAGAATDQSLYQLDSVWTSDVGREVKLGVLRGRVQVVAMFFTSCEYACPIIVEDMKRIERALPAALRGRVDFLLVSFDSERDTPEALRAFRDNRKLAVAHWTLLRGREDDVRELAALLGINYQRDARGQFAHSNVIHVFNREGEVIAQQAGLNQDGAGIVKTIERALATPDSNP